MKSSILSVLLALIGQIAIAQCSVASFTNHVDQFFKSHVSNGNIDYTTIHNNPSTLNIIVDKIAGKDISTFTRNEQLAFYINAYNVLVVKNVIDHYPIKSPLNVNGFFKSKAFTVASEQLTLNELENNKVRQFGDARIHFALVCGANGCPPIIAGAYQSNTLDAQLERQTKIAVNDINFTQVKPNGNVQLSQLFNWYNVDFVNDEQTLIDFINRYRETPIAKSAKVSFYEYDWNLNTQ